jgi:hypothetical protein
MCVTAQPPPKSSNSATTQNGPGKMLKVSDMKD